MATPEHKDVSSPIHENRMQDLSPMNKELSNNPVPSNGAALDVIQVHKRPRSHSRSKSRSKSHSRSPHERRRRRSYSGSRSPNKRRRRNSHSYSPRRSRSRERGKRYSRSRSFSPRRKRQGGAPVSKVLSIFGLNLTTKGMDVKDAFSKFGAVEGVDLVLDRRSQKSKGYGFIYFSSVDEAVKAKEQGHGMMLDGHTVRTDFSYTDKPHSPTPGKYMGRVTGSRGRYNERYSSYSGGGGGGGNAGISTNYRGRSPPPYHHHHYAYPREYRDFYREYPPPPMRDRYEDRYPTRYDDRVVYDDRYRYDHDDRYRR